MLRMILTIRKRDDLSREEFIDYYENKHTALVGGLLPPTAALYRRHYLLDDDPTSLRIAEARGEDSSLPEIAAITEAAFENRDDAEAFLDVFFTQEILEQILADENNFIAPDGVRWRVVEVRE